MKAVKQDPTDSLSCYAMADLLEEQGWMDFAFCYRWMGWYNRRPGEREGPRLRKRFVWYKEGANLFFPYGEDERYLKLPYARLPSLLYSAMEPKNADYLLYNSWETAVADLCKGLSRMRALLQQPPEKKDA
jgi:hypothetical protein